jgi:transposase
MLNFEGKTIYLACGHTDMRKSINGLAAIVEGSFKLDLYAHSVFIFCSRSRNRLKILEWDGDGFWLYFKRLEKGRFKWPSLEGNESTMILHNIELTHLLGSPKVIQKLLRKEVKLGAVI